MEPITVFVVRWEKSVSGCAGKFHTDVDSAFYLLHKRPFKGLLAGMWEFPNRVGEGKQGREALKSLLAERGILLMDTVAKRKPVKQIKHVFSHKVWQMSVYETCLAEGVVANPVLPSCWRWVPVTELADYNLAGPHNKILPLL